MGRKRREKQVRRQNKFSSPGELPFSRARILRLIVTFALLVIGLQFAAPLLFNLNPLQRDVAIIAGVILNFSGLNATVDGINIHYDRFHWEIVEDCTGFSAMILFVSFILVYPSSPWQKALATASGIPILFITNLLRLYLLALLTVHDPGIATAFHDYFWQIGMLLVVLGLWLLWIEWVTTRENEVPIPV